MGGSLPHERQNRTESFNCHQKCCWKCSKGPGEVHDRGAGRLSQKTFLQLGRIFIGDNRGSRCFQAEDVASPKTHRPENLGRARSPARPHISPQAGESRSPRADRNPGDSEKCYSTGPCVTFSGPELPRFIRPQGLLSVSSCQLARTLWGGAGRWFGRGPEGGS